MNAVALIERGMHLVLCSQVVLDAQILIVEALITEMLTVSQMVDLILHTKVGIVLDIPHGI